MSYYAWDPKIETHCLSPDSVDYLLSIAKELPANSVMLDIGCYIGGVTCLLSDCRPDCFIHGLDDLRWNGKIGKNHYKLPDGHVVFDLQGKSTVERFREVTGARNNITLHYGTSPHGDICQQWALPLDLVHIGFDACGYDQYMENISWWWTKIKNNGWISGQATSDGREAIEDFAAANDCLLTWIDHFFAGRKP
jgi:hypothetical protein